MPYIRITTDRPDDSLVCPECEQQIEHGVEVLWDEDTDIAIHVECPKPTDA